jgi:hypothetical protein
MKIRLALYGSLVAAASHALGGCFYVPSERSSARATGAAAPASATAQVGQAEVFQGTLGEIGSFSSEAAELRITASGSYATVRIDAVNAAARWWAMNNLTISGGLDHAALRPGAHLTFSRAGAAPGATGLRVTALGCSGPSRNVYTYDRNADSVDVDVMPGSEEGRNRMVFTARFDHGGATQTVQGSFEYDPR